MAPATSEVPITRLAATIVNIHGDIAAIDAAYCLKPIHRPSGPKLTQRTRAVARRTSPHRIVARRTNAAPVPAVRHADRRDLIREAVERRLAGSAGKKAGGSVAPRARKRGRPSNETASAEKDETLFAEKDEMTEERLEVLDELLKG